MDPTQPAQGQAPVSKAMLVTLLASIALNCGLSAAFITEAVGQVTPYAAAGFGAGTAIAVFGISMKATMFIRSNSHR
jgi:hypothetical protein